MLLYDAYGHSEYTFIKTTTNNFGQKFCIFRRSQTLTYDFSLGSKEHVSEVVTCTCMTMNGHSEYTFF